MAAIRKLIVAPTVGGDVSSRNWVWAGAASIISIGVHAGLIFLIMNVNLGYGGEPKDNSLADKATEVDDKDREKEVDLTSDEVGLDPEKPIQYDVDLIKDVSVPGAVSPTDPIGVHNAPDGPPKTVSAPPGVGQGTGLSPVLSEDGKGLNIGTVGGSGGLMMAGGFGGRSGATREKLLQEYGGNGLSEAAVASGLEWLAHHQAQDGHWSLHEFNRHAREKPYPAGKVFTDNSTGMSSRKNDVAGTAFGLLPFLAAGQTHRPAKNAKKDYSKSVKAALDYLIRKQDKTTGFYGGDMYAHGLATIAMCEAYGLTSDNLLKGSAQLAIHYIETSQDPTGGGWRYAPRTAGDLSVTGWQVMGLKSGQMSGLNVKEGTMKKVETFLRSCETALPGATTSSQKGGYSYMPGTGETPTMTAVGMLCAQYLGTTPRNRELIAGANRLKMAPPNTTKNLYYEYYATQVMHHMGGDNWKFWNEGPNGKDGIRDTLVKKQDTGLDKPSQRGSWEREGAGHANDGGRLMATSLSVLSLEVYYRHLPLYGKSLGTMKEKPK
jgi:hypothetical protein